MKVIHLSCVAPPETGGIGRVAAQEVAGLVARGIHARLISPTTHPTFWRVGNAAALNVHPIMRDLRDADIVHLHYPFYGTAGRIAQLHRQGRIRRLVITLHMDATANGWKGLVFDAHRRLFQDKILRSADALLVSSLDYARHSSFAQAADRCIELPFGVDEKIFDAGSKSGTGSSHVLDSRFQLLFVGGMDLAHAFKGVDVLLRAMVTLSRDARLTLVGDGDLRPSYEKLSRDLGIADRVTFLGRVSDEDLPGIYRSADVFVFPSTSGAEAFGLAALEAQSCGVPVVASDLPGVRTVVANGETGFLVPPRDADALAQRLAYLLGNPEIRESIGKRARERVLGKFTWTKHLDGLVEVYQGVMNHAPTS